jgi:hypothetical protein
MPVMLLFQVSPVQPVNVVIQQAPGMPEWIKILITAMAGAVVGFVSSLVMEFIKPAIAKRVGRKTVLAQLVGELTENISILEACFRILKVDEPHWNVEPALERATFAKLSSSTTDNRYQYYLLEQKAIVYELDEKKQLAEFYGRIKEYLPGTLKGEKIATAMLESTVYTGIGFLTFHKLKYKPVDVPEAVIEMGVRGLLEDQPQ